MSDGPFSWFSSHVDGIALAVVSGVAASSVTGFLRGVRGVGILVSHVATSVLVVATYPATMAYLNDDWKYGSLLGLLCGVCAFAVFQLLIKISDRVASRGTDIADKLVDKYTGKP